MTFSELGVQTTILDALEILGFETPTPIQAQTIPHLLGNQEQDLLAFAQTGTGKTAAFGIPILQQIDENLKDTQSIILAPTRELCMQIAKDINAYAKKIKKINIVAVYGGASIETQIKQLNKGAQIVVGTPGRTVDLIKRKKLKLQNINWLVLDEADEMLNMGFKEELDTILSETPDYKQTLLFSATMPKEVMRIAQRYMKDAKEIKVGEQNAGAKNVEHIYYVVKASNKYLALKRIADINPDIYGIVFCRTRRDTKDIADKLIEDGYNADALHGDLSQAQRDLVMQRFRTGNLQILVATDVAARGLDVKELSHVINYNLPDDPEVYVHRSGRTGRAGKKGISVTIAHSRELSKIRALEKMVKKTFEKALIPSGNEIVKLRLFNLIDKIKKTEVNETQIEPFLSTIFEKFEGLEREELIKKFVSVEFTRFLEYYKNTQDINIAGSTQSAQEQRKGQRRGMEFTRFYINLGTKTNLNPNTLIGLINDHTRSRNIEIGKIDMMKRFTFFEIDSTYENEVLKGLNNIDFKGITVSVEKSNPKPQNNKDSERYGRRRNRKKSSRDSGRSREKSFGAKRKRR